ncbi:MAG: ammonium transporter [Treponema sp.]|nr:ammonium transporter [Treponema sp.]
MTIDTLWMMLGATLIFFMQAGFAMLETGMTRAKNAGNIIMKNMLDFACGAPVFFLIGYRLMFGVLHLDGGSLVGSVPQWAHVAFNTMFCATAATIVSGAMAERTKFSAYLLCSIVISAVIFPVTGHWSWGGGWLSHLSLMNWTGGFHDFAGSANVHMVGGICALTGAMMLGPRIGKYEKDGKPKAILGHSITLAALGVFILWFGWFGFTSASTYGLHTEEQAFTVGSVFLTTNLSAATATVVTMAFTWLCFGKSDVSLTLNGALAGLVAITAGCDAVEPWAAIVIGAVAGVLVVLSIGFIEKKLKIDDPAGAISVHGVNGLWGTLAVGLFARDGGLFVTGEWGRFLTQAAGAVSILVFVGMCAFVLFIVLKYTTGLRVTASEEIAGLDMQEHGLKNSYAGFQTTFSNEEVEQAEEAGVALPIESAIPVAALSDIAAGKKMKEVVIITRQNKFDALKTALNKIGVTGMTVTNVLGCGVQKGASEFYRGVPVDVNVLPKVKVEVVVSKVPVEAVINAARTTLYTGHIGDGKIFVLDVEDAVKVRTGESGYDALQNEDEK